VKCALLEDGELFEKCDRDLEKAAAGDAAALEPLIEGAVRLKARIVAGDEREGGARAFLNLGHTVGHALEAATGYARFTHGEAVALGLRGALAISPLNTDRERALALVRRLQVAADVALDADQRESALQAMGRDKKMRGGKVRFVLLDSIGSPRLAEVTPDQCRAALDAALGGSP
jgi:3-dehydroquinate synthetase